VKHSDVVAVTFATTKKSMLFKNYNDNLLELEASLNQFGIQLEIYNLKKLKLIIRQLNCKWYLFYNKGVGAWFWKPLIISESMKKNRGKVIIYFDADCVVTKNPRQIVSELSLEAGKLYLFEQKLLIKDWTSTRCISRMNLNNSLILNSRMKTAGVIVARESEENIENLSVWSREMDDPLKLIDPLFCGKKHRHDQSVLSLLCSAGKVDSGDLGRGFYSMGPESISDSINNSWVYTGSVSPSIFDSRKNILFRNQLKYIKFQIFGLTYKMIILPPQTFLYHFIRFLSLARSAWARKKLFLDKFKIVGRS
jgi:hypothetical protein